MSRALWCAVLIACGSPKQPAATNDLDLPRRSEPVEAEAPPVVDAALPVEPQDASVPDARVVSPEAAACDEDPAAKQACESMGATFAPRMVTPCHRGADAPIKPVPRCMCVDTSKPRDCPPKK